MKIIIWISIVFLLGLVSGDEEIRIAVPEPQPEPEEPVTNMALGHITTDKPVYKPNDMAFIEVYVFDPRKHGLAKPTYSYRDWRTDQTIVRDQEIYATMKILDSNDNEMLTEYRQNAIDGTVAFTYKVPKDAKGGEYTIHVTSEQFPESIRKFRINQFSQPELFITVDFEKQNYAAGDDVSAKVKVRRPDGEALAPGSSISYSVPIKNSRGSVENIEQSLLTLNNQGEIIIEFTIPADSTSDVVSVALNTYMGFSQEKKSATPFVSSHSVPILKKDAFKVEFSSEWSVNGLVGGVENKVYFQVLSTETNAPIEFHRAKLVSNTSGTTRDVLQKEIKHVNNGRSYFTFVPEKQKDQIYFLQVTKSAGDSFDDAQKFALPRVDTTKVANAHTTSDSYLKIGQVFDLSLIIPESESQNREPISVSIDVLNSNIKIYEATKTVDWLTESCFGDPCQRQTDISITLTNEMYTKVPNGGILVVQIYDKENKIDLEKMIFLQPPDSSHPEFQILTNKEAYQPGETVELDVQFNAPAIEDDKIFVSITVTDVSSFLELPQHKLMPSLAAMTHLEKEIKQLNGKVCEFDNSADYIDTLFSNSREMTSDGIENLELLLGTQQWRKGALRNLQNLENQIWNMEDGSEEKLRLQYLLGKSMSQPEIMFDMDDMMMMPMAMADGPPRMAMAEAAGMAMEKNEMGKAAMVKKAPEQEDEAMPLPEEKKAGSETESGPLSQTDFMSYDLIKRNTREYMHQLRKGYDKTTRVDFTQTLLFVSAKQLKLQEGTSTYKFSTSFALNDQVSQFQVSVNLFSSNGKLSMEKKTLTSSMPAYSKFTLPTTLMRGDKVDIPITITNNYPTDMTVYCSTSKYLISETERSEEGIDQQQVSLKSKSQKQIIYELDVSSDAHMGKDFVEINVELRTEAGSDAEVIDTVVKTLRLMTNGFPDELSNSGRIGVKDSANPDKFKVETSAGKDFVIPATIASSPYFTAKLFAKPLDSILDALESLVRDPYGCFEQTSSVTYPMVMALQLLNEMQKSLSKEEDILRVRKMKYDIMEKLKKGYDRLTGFETSTKGYEWFGDSPGHEALSAYGIAQFNDMNKVVNFVEESSLNRNVDWLMGRRDKTGKWSLNPRSLDTFGAAAQDITDAYLVWVMTQESRFSFEDLKDEFANLETISRSSKDPYFLALYSGALFNTGKKEEATAISERIVSSQNDETGAVEGATSSITSSRGQSLLLETTSLAVVNWLNQSPSTFSANIDLGVGFILNSIKKGGRFGGTQSTVLCLKALVRYTQIYQGIVGSGNFVLYVNDKKIKSVEFKEGQDFQIKDLDFSQDVYDEFTRLYPSECAASETFKLRIAIEDYAGNAAGDGFALSYLFQLEFQNSQPYTSQNAPILFDITKEPKDLGLAVGATQTQTIKIDNISGQAQGMTVAVVSATGCSDIDMNQLEILKEKASIDNFEISSDKTTVTLYWTYLKESESKEVDLIFVKKIDNPTGLCQRRASQAYLYYQDEDKVWLSEESFGGKCSIEVFDYTKPRETVPDPVNPVRPPRPPVFIAGRPQPRAVPVMALDDFQLEAMAVWDAAPVAAFEEKLEIEEGFAGFPCKKDAVGQEGEAGSGKCGENHCCGETCTKGGKCIAICNWTTQNSYTDAREGTEYLNFACLEFAKRLLSMGTAILASIYLF